MSDITAETENFGRILRKIFHVYEHELSVGGRVVYRLLRALDFAPLNIIVWLETCPGAFRDDFGGW
jgi:hypothetical protein